MRAWAALDSVLRVDAPEAVLADLDDLLGPGSPAQAVTGRVTVSGDGAVRVDGTPEPRQDDLVSTVLTALNRTVLAQCRSFASHAGVVSRGAAAVALPGGSGAGKTTLTAACLQAGLGYLSDEALVLAGTGRVRPYPRPLSMSAWSLQRLGLAVDRGTLETPVAPGLLTTQVPPDDVRVAHVVVPRRGRAGPPALLAADRADTAALLLRRSFNHFRAPAEALATAAGVVRGARCWTLDHDDPVAAAEVVADLLS